MWSFLSSSDSDPTSANYTDNTGDFSASKIKYNIKAIYFDNSVDEPALSDSVINTAAPFISSLDKNTCTIEKDSDSGHYMIKISLEKLSFSAGESTISSINRLQTVLKSSSNNGDDILFSEAKFDDIPVTNELTVDMNYYIYF